MELGCVPTRLGSDHPVPHASVRQRPCGFPYTDFHLLMSLLLDVQDSREQHVCVLRIEPRVWHKTRFHAPTYITSFSPHSNHEEAEC